MDRLTPRRIRAIAPIALTATALLLSRCGGGNSPPGSPSETASLSALSINPTTVVGGDPVDGNVTVTPAATGEGATVVLSTDNAAVVNLPANVRVAAGTTSATFRATTSAVNAETMVRITGSFGATQNQVLTVMPRPAAMPSLASLSLVSGSVVGGNSVEGTVTITAPAPASGVTVSLTSSDAAVATVPPTVTVGSGATTASFAVSTRAVGGAVPITITASAFGLTQSQVLTVTPPPSQPMPMPTLASISLASSSILGGNPVQGTVTMTGPAPSSGVTVGLTSSDTGVATVPSTVTVGSGATTASFAVSTKAVGVATSITITAAYGGGTRPISLTVTPPPVVPIVLVANPNGPYDGYACEPNHPISTCGTTASLITMTAKGSTSSPNPIAHWYWDCGQTGNPNCLKDEITPSFSYIRTGFNNTMITYTVTLIIEDTLGNRSAPATTTVLVRQRY